MMTPESPENIGLRVSNLTMRYRTSHKDQFTNLNFEVARSGRLAIMGRNGQGKSTLIKILGGVLPPTGGKVDWQMTSSWPIGFGGGFQGSTTGLDNIKFLARLYNRDLRSTLARVDRKSVV